MKKILVLFTGGTIGSATTDGIIDVEREGKYAVVEAYKSAYGDDVEFECRQVLNILSENMGFSGWEKMIHEINSIDTALYSGVILTHWRERVERAFQLHLGGGAYKRGKIQGRFHAVREGHASYEGDTCRHLSGQVRGIWL